MPIYEMTIVLKVQIKPEFKARIAQGYEIPKCLCLFAYLLKISFIPSIPVDNQPQIITKFDCFLFGGGSQALKNFFRVRTVIWICHQFNSYDCIPPCDERFEFFEI